MSSRATNLELDTAYDLLVKNGSISNDLMDLVWIITNIHEADANIRKEHCIDIQVNEAKRILDKILEESTQVAY